MRLEQDFPSHYEVRLALTCWAKGVFDVLHPLDGASPAAATPAGGVAGGPQPARSLQSCSTTAAAPRNADESDATLTCPAVSGAAIAAAGPSQPPAQRLPQHGGGDGFWGAAPPALPWGHMQQHGCSPAHAELHGGRPVQPFAAQQHLLPAAPPPLQHHQLAGGLPPWLLPPPGQGGVPIDAMAVDEDFAGAAAGPARAAGSPPAYAPQHHHHHQHQQQQQQLVKHEPQEAQGGPPHRGWGSVSSAASAQTAAAVRLRRGGASVASVTGASPSSASSSSCNGLQPMTETALHGAPHDAR